MNCSGIKVCRFRQNTWTRMRANGRPIRRGFQEVFPMNKTIAIIGLGLIGGSMAMALKGFEEFEIVGVDTDPATLDFAAGHGVADRLTDDAGAAIAGADLVFLCLRPKGIVDFLHAHRDDFKPGALVTDVCGIKTAIVDAAAVLPPQVGFIGGHPMAGKETSGVFHADGKLFQGAPLHPHPPARSPSGAPGPPPPGGRPHRLPGRGGDHHPKARRHHRLHQPGHAHPGGGGVRRPRPLRVPGLRGGLLPRLHPGGRPGRAPVDPALLHERPALTKVIRDLEDNLRAYRLVLERGDTAALTQKLAWSADRKRRMNLE